MRSTFKNYIQNSKEPLLESIVGKGFAISQNRAHATNKTKFLSVLSRIQSNAKKGLTEEDENERFELLLSLFFDLAGALKILAEMSANTNNISTTAVLDAENIQKTIEIAIAKNSRK